ncbi:MAG: hypothetical protein GX638_02475, partial [Crenarchaeota archaeon]|nr:hypothetical protein [Thermoproteota archaeon]
KKKERDLTNADTFKPFLCGEAASDQYDFESGLHYQALIPNEILDKTKNRLDVDRFYSFLIKKFNALTSALSKFDVGQHFPLAFASFIIGTIVFLIIAIFAV